MKRQQTLEEEKTIRQSKRELSADQNLFRNQVGQDPASRRGTIMMMNDTLAGTNYQTKKKVIDDEETENLIEKCMLSQPNKYSLDQIKKQHAFVWSFGQNTKGELGVGHYNEVLMPERVRGLPKMKIVQISSGAKHTGAVSEDGKLWMCGSNLHDKLGLEGITTGSKKTFKPVELLNHVQIIQVACGDYHTLALTNEGQVYAWGGSLHNKRGDKSEERKGTAKYKPVQLKSLETKKIVQIACGDFHSLARDNNGTLYSWGVGQKGECGHGKFEDIETPMRIKFFDGKKIVLIEAGNHHSLALTSDNELYAWGDGRFGQCGYGEYENTAIPQLINFPQLNNNQTQFLDDSSQNDLFDFLKDQPKIKQIAAGEMHSLVLTSNGQIYSFGYNQQGQLGLNNTDNYCKPMLVEGMLTHRVVQIAAGRNHSLALTTKNDVYACGNGQQGQLGLPDREMRKTFTHVLSLMSVNSVKLYAGGFHSWAVLDEMMPKKDEFQQLKGHNSNDDDSLLNSNDDYNQFNSHIDVGGGKSIISNSNFYQDRHQKYIIQLNYTDTGLSHRFIRFEISEQNYEQGKAKVEDYIRQIYKEESGTIYHKLQEDQDIIGEKGQVLSAGQGKFGKFFTLQIVSDISKNEDSVEPKRELIKNNYDFIDEIYDLFIRHAFGVVGHKPQKTSIGLQIFIGESDVNQSEYEKKLCSWAALFAKTMSLCFDQHPINEDYVNDIKQKTESWEPHSTDQNPLNKYSQDELKMLLGTRLKPAFGTMTPQMENVDLPQEFDSRDKWTNCIHKIRNQMKCGSCWAFAAAEAFSDRICIATSESINEEFSPESLLECDKRDFGCNGGELNTVWNYLEHDGIVLEKCEPYVSGEGEVPQCTMKCTDPSVGYQRFHCKPGSVVEAINKEQIKQQVFLYGPMETGFEVYEDFFNYRSGVYHHVSGGLAGGHAVKILGWGQQNGLDYWLCANSWGPEWGENGFFKIKMGEGGIDQSVWACIPDTTKQILQPIR